MGIKLPLILLILLITQQQIKADERIVTEEFTAKVFNQDSVVGWVVSGNKQGRLVGTCENQSTFGGFDIFGQGAVATKQFNSGVDHYELVFTFELFAIDSWDDEVFSLKLDDVEIYNYSTQHNKEPPSGSRKISCGSGNWSDKFVLVSVTVPHSSRFFSLQMSSTLNQDANDESWGVRNLRILANYAGENSLLISEEFSSINFKDNTNGWILNPPLLNPFTNCGKDRLFGGYNTFGEKLTATKQFHNLPEHWGIVINLTLWLIDSPDANDFVTISVDGQQYKFNRSHFDYGKNKVCGNADWGENVRNVNAFIPHISSSANVSFSDNFDEKKDNESWGIQNLVITLLTGKSDKQNLIVNEFSSNNFKEAPGWTIVGSGQDVSKKISTCAGASLFGGYNQLSTEDVQKVYKNIPLHTNVRIFFRLFAIDSWDNEDFRILIDDVLVQSRVAPYQQSTKMCGVDGWDDRIRNYIVDVPHTGSSLKLTFFSDLNQGADDESYGIRDLKIWTYNGGQHTKIVSSEFNDYNNWTTGGWTVKPNVNPVSSTCGPYKLFGGYNVFGLKTLASKTYSALPEHNRVIVTFKIFFIDTWDKEDLFVNFDDVLVGKKTKSETWGGQEQLCGMDNSKEEVYTVQFSAYHDKSDFTLSIGDKLDQVKNDESWGIRDLVVAVQKSTAYVEDDACVIIYSECDFQGQKLKVCQNIPDLSSVGWNVPVKSIEVPNNVRSRIFEKTNYTGSNVSALKTVKCLVGTSFVQVGSSLGIFVEDNQDGNKLRKQN